MNSANWLNQCFENENLLTIDCSSNKEQEDVTVQFNGTISNCNFINCPNIIIKDSIGITLNNLNFSSPNKEAKITIQHSNVVVKNSTFDTVTIDCSLSTCRIQNSSFLNAINAAAITAKVSPLIILTDVNFYQNTLTGGSDLEIFDTLNFSWIGGISEGDFEIESRASFYSSVASMENVKYLSKSQSAKIAITSLDSKIFLQHIQVKGVASFLVNKGIAHAKDILIEDIESTDQSSNSNGFLIVSFPPNTDSTYTTSSRFENIIIRNTNTPGIILTSLNSFIDKLHAYNNTIQQTMFGFGSPDTTLRISNSIIENIIALAPVTQLVTTELNKNTTLIFENSTFASIFNENVNLIFFELHSHAKLILENTKITKINVGDGVLIQVQEQSMLKLGNGTDISDIYSNGIGSLIYLEDTGMVEIAESSSVRMQNNSFSARGSFIKISTEFFSYEAVNINTKGSKINGTIWIPSLMQCDNLFSRGLMNNVSGEVVIQSVPSKIRLGNVQNQFESFNQVSVQPFQHIKPFFVTLLDCTGFPATAAQSDELIPVVYLDSPVTAFGEAVKVILGSEAEFRGISFNLTTSNSVSVTVKGLGDTIDYNVTNPDWPTFSLTILECDATTQILVKKTDETLVCFPLCLISDTQRFSVLVILLISFLGFLLAFIHLIYNYSYFVIMEEAGIYFTTLIAAGNLSCILSVVVSYLPIGGIVCSLSSILKVLGYNLNFLGYSMRIFNTIQYRRRTIQKPRNKVSKFSFKPSNLKKIISKKVEKFSLNNINIKSAGKKKRGISNKELNKKSKIIISVVVLSISLIYLIFWNVVNFSTYKTVKFSTCVSEQVCETSLFDQFFIYYILGTSVLLSILALTQKDVDHNFNESGLFSFIFFNFSIFQLLLLMIPLNILNQTKLLMETLIIFVTQVASLVAVVLRPIYLCKYHEEYYQTYEEDWNASQMQSGAPLDSIKSSVYSHAVSSIPASTHIPPNNPKNKHVC
ncbi:hypothetical protein HDU92_004251 [Lobulomyces angularis]|nr:hypothetical protein HDU92_004251 [Lobulomyces angularis]